MTRRWPNLWRDASFKLPVILNSPALAPEKSALGVHPLLACAAGRARSRQNIVVPRPASDSPKRVVHEVGAPTSERLSASCCRAKSYLNFCHSSNPAGSDGSRRMARIFQQRQGARASGHLLSRPRRLDPGDIDPAHGHHGVHRPLRGGAIRVVQRGDQNSRHDLP